MSTRENGYYWCKTKKEWHVVQYEDGYWYFGNSLDVAKGSEIYFSVDHIEGRKINRISKINNSFNRGYSVSMLVSIVIYLITESIQ